MEKIYSFTVGEDVNSFPSPSSCVFLDSVLDEEEQKKVFQKLENASIMDDEIIDKFCSFDDSFVFQALLGQYSSKSELDKVASSLVLQAISVASGDAISDLEGENVFFGYGEDSHLIMRSKNTEYKFFPEAERVIEDALSINYQLIYGYPDQENMESDCQNLAFDILLLSCFDIKSNKGYEMIKQ